MKDIRNFAIVAHIDHGKSTLADRFLEHTGILEKKEENQQILDTMDLERERGITIKAHPVRMEYVNQENKRFIFNLIDTPGHVDFTYEVSRGLVATEGIILLVDATQGVEAQTLAHAYLAKKLGKKIIPVVNKIDLPNADISKSKEQLREILKIASEDILLVSAKEDTGVKELLEEIPKSIPPPQGSHDAPLKALIFDSWYNPYLGVIIYVRVFDGILKPDMEIMFYSNKKIYKVHQTGIFRLDLVPTDFLLPGEVGYISAGIKEIKDVKIGDTICSAENPDIEPLPGYKEPKPMVFCGLYPANTSGYQALVNAVEKLHLNDASWVYEPESSLALGAGFRCGFLGLLHLEIIQERLEREYDLDLIATTPTVPYRITKRNDEVIEVENPIHFPPANDIVKTEEPYIEAMIISPAEHLGSILKLLNDRRGIQISMEFIEGNVVKIVYHLPLAEVVSDFYDKLKSVSQGYASMDYEIIGYKVSDLVKLDILLAGERIDALSYIIHKDKAYQKARILTAKLKELLPRQNFAVSIQAAIGSRVIARETIPAFRKDVTAKCYGGDITRKRKLWEKQKRGKKRLKQYGKVTLNQEAFRALLASE
jgi:GTP-binding protein LepA